MADSADTPATARVSACRARLEKALRVKDAADVERRLAVLEGRVGDAPVH